MAGRLNVLIVATKPPWPPVDGGRVVVLNTVDALAAAGHRVTLVAPVDPAADHGAARGALAGRCRAELVPVRPPGVRAAALSSMLRGRPLTVERHRLRAVAERVRQLGAAEAFAASLQQLASDPALRARVVEGGRARLRSQHDPAQVAAQLALSGSRDDWTTVSTATISCAAGLSGVAAFRFVAHQGFDFVGINGAMQRRFAGTEQAS